jgi:hypothetical protein
MSQPTIADYDRQLVEIFAEIRHQGRVLAAAEIVCHEAQSFLVRNGLWDDEVPGDAAGLKRAIERWEAIKASRGGA